MSLIRSAFAAIGVALALLCAASLAVLVMAIASVDAGTSSGGTGVAAALRAHGEGVAWHYGAWLSAAFALVAAVLAAALFALHRRGLGPLAQFEAQILALGERRFVSVVQPDIAEWVQLSKALNVMVSRVQLMLEDRDTRLARIRAEIDHDAMTGVASRTAFLSACESALQAAAAERGPAAPEAGAVVIVRVHDLVGTNQRLGRDRTDDLLRDIATALRTRLHRQEAQDALLARLNGADFAVLLPGMRGEVLTQWLQSVADLLRALRDAPADGAVRLAWVGATTYRLGEPMSDVLARSDAMIGAAEHQGNDYALTSPRQPLHSISVAKWRTVLEQALDTNALHLAFDPVVTRDGSVWHREAMLCLRGPDSVPIAAAIFAPPAVRTGRIVDLDLRAVSMALAGLRRTPGDVAVKLSPHSLARPMFHARLAEQLAAAAAQAHRLWLDIDESVLDAASDDLPRLLATARPHGCRIGIDHFGAHLSAMPRLTDLRVSHLKLRAPVCDGIDASAGQQNFVALVVQLATAAGIAVIAQGVRRESDLACLTELGVLAASGPLLSQRLQAMDAAAVMPAEAAPAES